MISRLVRLILACGGVVTGWFVAVDSPNFQIIQAAVGLLLFALVIFRPGVVAEQLVAPSQSHRPLSGGMARRHAVLATV